MGQGNIFTSVCQEFCSQGGGAWSGGCLLPGGCLLLGVWFQGVPSPGGVCSGGGVPGPVGMPGGDPPMATAAGGTHPTGMHSCSHLCFFV